MQQLASSPPEVSARFFIEAVIDQLASQREGREVYRDEERIELSFLRNPYMRPIRPVTDQDRQQWATEYEIFRRGLEVATHGTAIDTLPFLTPSQVQELKSLGFSTVEDLRDMSDDAVQALPMGRRLKQLAEAYLDDAAALAALTKAQAENDRLTSENVALRHEVENLREQNSRLFTQLQSRLDAPNPIAVTIPTLPDPPMRAPSTEPAQSSFAGLPEITPRRRKPAAAAPAGAE